MAVVALNMRTFQTQALLSETFWAKVPAYIIIDLWVTLINVNEVRLNRVSFFT